MFLMFKGLKHRDTDPITKSGREGWNGNMLSMAFYVRISTEIIIVLQYNNSFSCEFLSIFVGLPDDRPLVVLPS